MYTVYCTKLRTRTYKFLSTQKNEKCTDLPSGKKIKLNGTLYTSAKTPPHLDIQEGQGKGDIGVDNPRLIVVAE